MLKDAQMMILLATMADAYHLIGNVMDDRIARITVMKTFFSVSNFW